VHQQCVPCTVKTGTLADPYTGTTISFLRGTTTSSAVQIDHVVALSDAWQKGVQFTESLIDGVPERAARVIRIYGGKHQIAVSDVPTTSEGWRNSMTRTLTQGNLDQR
jgi:hypothetical protein